MTDPKVEVLPKQADEEHMGSGTALVASGATLMRIEHDAMLAVSIQRPRDKRRVRDAVMEELDLAPELAQDCYYSIPYKDRATGKTRMVEGPSIHAARNIVREWGNCSIKSGITGEDEEKVYITGVFTDLETNVRFERPQTVSKFQHRRDGSRVKLYDERLVQAIGAALSKAERNAIIAGLPSWLVHKYYLKVRSLGANEARQRLGKMITAFEILDVSREMLEAHAGRPLDELDSEGLATLRGIYNALQDGVATVEELFGKPKSSSNETINLDDVLEAGVEEEDAVAEEEASDEEVAPISARNVALLKAEIQKRAGQLSKKTKVDAGKLMTNMTRALLLAYDGQKLEDLIETDMTSAVEWVRKWVPVG